MKTSIFTAALLLISCFCASQVLALELGGLEESRATAGYGAKAGTESEIASYMGKLISVVISLVGLIFLAILLTGSFLITGANGDQEKVQKGVSWVKNGAIGILAVFIAYVFAKLFIGYLGGAGLLTNL